MRQAFRLAIVHQEARDFGARVTGRGFPPVVRLGSCGGATLTDRRYERRHGAVVVPCVGLCAACPFDRPDDRDKERWIAAVVTFPASISFAPHPPAARSPAVGFELTHHWGPTSLPWDVDRGMLRAVGWEARFVGGGNEARSSRLFAALVAGVSGASARGFHIRRIETWESVLA